MTVSTPHAALLPLSIIATGAALPPGRVDSCTLDAVLNRPAGDVEKRSGVRHRYHAALDASQAELAAQALEDALARQRIEPGSIDLLISTSAVPMQALPCTAALILKASSLPSGTPGFDINCSCVGFITALQVAAGLLNAGTYARIAIVSSDLVSRGIDWDDDESALILGDGAACAIVERSDGSSGILGSLIETYPQGSDLCEIQAGGTRRNPRTGMTDKDFLFHMQGKPLFRQAAALIGGFLARLLARSGLSLGDIVTVVPHQASHLSLEHMRKRLGVPSEVLVDIYREHGNQVSASIPTALHTAFTTGRYRPGEPVMLIGTAAGLTLAGLVLVP
jgi:3-oxoacyl-[acyl-carrier-protein] synthase-3